MTKPPELFPERPVQSYRPREPRGDYAQVTTSYGKRRLITVMVVLTVAAGGAYAAWRHRAPLDPSQVPTIVADGPYKQKPDNPGGIDIPHQDVQLYRELDNSTDNASGVEHLLPPPEVPKPPVPASADAHPTDTPPAAPAATEATPNALESLLPPAPPPVTTVKQVATVAPAPNPSPVPPVTVAPAPMPQATNTPESLMPPVAPPKPAPPPPSSAAPHGSIVVQLAALTAASMAQADMVKLQLRYQSALGTTLLRVVRADLGAKGVYYRIQSGPVSEAQAGSICAAIKQSNGGCVIVRN